MQNYLATKSRYRGIGPPMVLLGPPMQKSIIFVRMKVFMPLMAANIEWYFRVPDIGELCCDD